VGLRRHAEGRSSAGVAGALHRQLHAVGQQLGQAPAPGPAPFASQPADDGQNSGRVGASMRQAQFGLQRRLAGHALPARRLGVVALGDGGSVAGFQTASSMPLRMPRDRAAAADHAVQPAAELVGGDLARVGGADGGHAVGELQPGLHERQLAVELQPAGDMKRAGRPSRAEVVHRKQALEGQVVHREHRAAPGGRVGGHVGAGHGGMPVVRVHDLGHPAGVEFAGGQVRGHPAQQRKTLQVVGPLAPSGVLVGAAARRYR
jgi:hypothetical protein